MADPLTLKQVAAISGYKASTLKRMCWDGTIPGAVKPGRDWMIPEKVAKGLHNPGPGKQKERIG